VVKLNLHTHTCTLTSWLSSSHICSVPKIEENGGLIIIHFLKVITQNITPKVDGNGAFSYIVIKMINNDPYLDYFSPSLLDDNFIVKQSSKFGLF